MATTMRQSADTLAWLAALEAEPERFDFTAVLRFLDAKHPEKPRIGEAIKASDEVMVLRQEPSMRFAVASLSRFEPASTSGDTEEESSGSQHKHALYNLAFGLFGPNGPMPLHITEQAFNRQYHAGDATLSRFADIFHHRMLSLFYRADANTQPAIAMDRPDDNAFDDFTGALAGLANSNPMQPEDDRYKGRKQRWHQLYRSGLLAMKNKPADGLKSLLQDYLGCTVTILQFTGDWLQLSKQDQWQLQGFSRRFQLGTNTTLGQAVFDVQHKFTVSIGALCIDRFRRLLPGTPDFSDLRDMIRLYCGDQYDWDIELKLKAEQIPVMQLGRQGELGWTTWMGKPDIQQGHTTLTLKNKGF